MSHLRRLATAASAVAASAALLGLGTVPASASATTTDSISGFFEYSDLVGGNNRITNPTEGTCYYVTTLALSGFNNTNARATTYTDLNCTILGTVVNPGNTAVFPFASVRFTLP